jgi:hypothetical protein
MTYLAGIDLGQTTEPSALAVLEKTGSREQAVYSLRVLDRFELGTRYEDVAPETLGRLTAAPLAGARGQRPGRQESLSGSRPRTLSHTPTGLAGGRAMLNPGFTAKVSGARIERMGVAKEMNR